MVHRMAFSDPSAVAVDAEGRWTTSTVDREVRCAVSAGGTRYVRGQLVTLEADAYAVVEPGVAVGQGTTVTVDGTGAAGLDGRYRVVQVTADRRGALVGLRRTDP